MLQALHELLQAHPWWFFLALHLTVGRLGSVTWAVADGLDPWVFAPLAFALDCAQVPLWWWLFDAVARRSVRQRWLSGWITRREDRAEHRRLWRRMGALGDMGVVLLAALPLWGCGMWTATLLAWTIGTPLRHGAWILAAGGLVGLTALMALEFGVKSLVF